jgi:hypothetical protein
VGRLGRGQRAGLALGVYQHGAFGLGSGALKIVVKSVPSLPHVSDYHHSQVPPWLTQAPIQE